MSSVGRDNGYSLCATGGESEIRAVLRAVAEVKSELGGLKREVAAMRTDMGTLQARHRALSLSAVLPRRAHLVSS